MRLYQDGITSSSPAFRNFFEQCDSSSITELFRPTDFEKWNEMKTPKFIEKMAGTLIVKQMYPEETGYIVAIIQVHPGFTQYNSALAPLSHSLRFLIALKLRILLHLQSLSPNLSTKEALQDLVQNTNSWAKTVGLTDRLEEVRAQLCRLAKVLLSKAIKAGNNRMFERIAKASAEVDGIGLNSAKELEQKVTEEKKAYYSRKGDAARVDFRK